MAVLLSVSARNSSWWHTGRASLALLILSAVLLAPALFVSLWAAAARLPRERRRAAAVAPRAYLCDGAARRARRLRRFWSAAHRESRWPC